LDAWHHERRSATLWWRDDDAARSTPELDRLLALCARHGVPVALAIVPETAEPALAARLRDEPLVHVVQHGYAHVNHAPATEKKNELGAHRPPSVRLEELASGRDRLGAFPRFLPALAPPWNRIADDVLPDLPTIGLSALSTFGRRRAREPVQGLRQTNVHIDPVAWKNGRRFVGLAAALDQVVTHLRERREGKADRDEATGLLTHHMEHDESGWHFLDALFTHTRSHSAARWIDPEDALWG
jgi:peptidoglycan/xylan/chitin deacetylase (PgdA/CDA1 family)